MLSKSQFFNVISTIWRSGWSYADKPSHLCVLEFFYLLLCRLITGQALREHRFMTCSVEQAPWYVIPANKKWFRNWAVAKIITDTLTQMKIKYPKSASDYKNIKIWILFREQYELMCTKLICRVAGIHQKRVIRNNLSQAIAHMYFSQDFVTLINITITIIMISRYIKKKYKSKI